MGHRISACQADRLPRPLFRPCTRTMRSNTLFDRQDCCTRIAALLQKRLCLAWPVQMMVLIHRLILDAGIIMKERCDLDNISVSTQDCSQLLAILDHREDMVSPDP